MAPGSPLIFIFSLLEFVFGEECTYMGLTISVPAGLSIGIASSIVPVYQSEIAPKEIRGRVVSLQQWAITWGILIQYFIQYGASNVSPPSPSPDTFTT